MGAYVRCFAALCFLLGLRSPGGPIPAGALRLLDLKVPENAELNGNVTLECSFDLGNDGANLYCVKWYKDDHEFFRFTPDDVPPIKLFPNNGIIVDKERLSMTSVGLKNLAWDSSGSYRCEVSTEAPNFETVVRSADMTVIARPREDPIVEGFLSTYSVGDLVVGNCTSSKSNPAAALEWFVNGRKVDRFSLVYYSPWSDHLGLLTSRLGLSFKVEAAHFRDAPPSTTHSRRLFELRCTSAFRGQVRSRLVKSTIYAPPSLSDQRPAKHEGAPGSSPRSGPGFFVIAAVAMLVIHALQTAVTGTVTSS